MSLLKVHICSSSEGFVTWDGNASSKSWKTSLKKKSCARHDRLSFKLVKGTQETPKAI